jgi:predicted RNase H-like HicB family nuclease
MRYAIVIEKAGKNFSAYAPDLPGCVATGETIDSVKTQMKEAVRFHLDGLVEDGQPIPEPSSSVEYIAA